MYGLSTCIGTPKFSGYRIPDKQYPCTMDREGLHVKTRFVLNLEVHVQFRAHV
eukprot:SAG31_NODE_3953_length_3721_cov_3.909994_1_plen_53_part_00